MGPTPWHESCQRGKTHEKKIKMCSLHAQMMQWCKDIIVPKRTSGTHRTSVEWFHFPLYPDCMYPVFVVNPLLFLLLHRPCVCRVCDGAAASCLFEAAASKDCEGAACQVNYNDGGVRGRYVQPPLAESLSFLLQWFKQALKFDVRWKNFSIGMWIIFLIECLMLQLLLSGCVVNVC